jgi:hypothetical protein
MSQETSTTLWNKIWTARRMLELKGVRTHLLQGRKMRERWAKANHKAIYGEAEDCSVVDDEMGDMTLGDRITNNHSSNPLLTAFAVAGLLLGGGSLAALSYALSRPPETERAVERVVNRSDQVEVLEPIVRRPGSQ